LADWLFILVGMPLLELSWVWSMAAAAVIWFAFVALISLIGSKGNVAECVDVWRFALVEAFERLMEAVPRAQTKSDARATAKQLSDVLQIPIVDAELALELSGAFFHPTDDAELNGEAVELLIATPRNESWRTQASECCRKLRGTRLGS
jgi:hypothetical protein